MKKRTISVIFLICLVLSATTAQADYRGDFNRVRSSLQTNRKSFHDQDTAKLIVDAASVIHEENLNIMKMLEELKREVSALKKAIDQLKAGSDNKQ